jgi:hypothetical protein
MLKEITISGAIMDQQEFLLATLNLIRRHNSSTTPEGLKAAQLGTLLRRTYPDVDWTVYGYLKLRDFLSDLESQGNIRTGLDSKKALSVWLPSAEPSLATATAPAPTHPFRPLRRDVWSAFITGNPGDHNFVNRQSGVVHFKATEPPVPAEQWVEVAPISQGTQQQWARQFLAEHHPIAKAETVSTIDMPNWYQVLPHALAKESPLLSAAWNRQRSRKVQEHVLGWCRTHGVPENLVFETFPMRRSDWPVAPAAPLDLRAALLDAISRMNTEDLLEIQIPTKHLVGALRPDLLRRPPSRQVNG